MKFAKYKLMTAIPKPKTSPVKNGDSYPSQKAALKSISYVSSIAVFKLFPASYAADY